MGSAPARGRRTIQDLRPRLLRDLTGDGKAYTVGHLDGGGSLTLQDELPTHDSLILPRR